MGSLTIGIDFVLRAPCLGIVSSYYKVSGWLLFCLSSFDAPSSRPGPRHSFGSVYPYPIHSLNMVTTPGGLSIMRALLFTIALIHVSNVFMHTSAAVIPLDSGLLAAPFHIPKLSVRNLFFERATNGSKSNGCNVEPYTAPAIGQQKFPPFDQAKATVFRYRQQQSVNLGSW